MLQFWFKIAHNHQNSYSHTNTHTDLWCADKKPLHLKSQEAPKLWVCVCEKPPAKGQLIRSHDSPSRKETRKQDNVSLNECVRVCVWSDVTVTRHTHLLNKLQTTHKTAVLWFSDVSDGKNHGTVWSPDFKYLNLMLTYKKVPKRIIVCQKKWY